MKYKLIIIFSFFVSLCFAQKTNNDLEDKVNNIETKYLKNIDSLQKELLFFKMKEDHYTTALEVQAGHYEHTTTWAITIATLLLGLAGLLGFGWFLSKYEKMKERLIGLEKKIDTNLEESKNTINNQTHELDKRFKKLEIRSNISYANTLSLAAENARSSNKFFLAYRYFISSSHVRYEYESNFRRNVIINLNSALNCLTRLSNNQNFDNDEIEKTKSQLEELVQSENEDIKKLAKSILQEHNKKFKNSNISQ